MTDTYTLLNVTANIPAKEIIIHTVEQLDKAQTNLTQLVYVTEVLSYVLSADAVKGMCTFIEEYNRDVPALQHLAAGTPPKHSNCEEYNRYLSSYQFVVAVTSKARHSILALMDGLINLSRAQEALANRLDSSSDAATEELRQRAKKYQKEGTRKVTGIVAARRLMLFDAEAVADRAALPASERALTERITLGQNLNHLRDLMGNVSLLMLTAFPKWNST